MATATLSRPQARRVVDRAQDPVWFCRTILGHDPWALPERIMQAVAQPRARVAVKSCHGSGKTFSAAEIVLWWTVVMRGLAITTAPTWHQVERLLWSEVRRAHAGARFPLGGELLQTEYRIGPNNYAVGLSTNEGVRFQGFHADRVLVILDEAPGVAADIYEAIEGVLAAGDARMLMLGNPVVSSGPFYDAFTRDLASWTTFTIDALATPNFTDDLSRPMRLDELRALTAEELAIAPRPYLVTRQWVREKLEQWGEESPLFASRVRGAFPAQSEDALISLAWLERAAIPVDPIPYLADPIVAGVDVAGPGEDETVLTLRTAGRAPYRILSIQVWASADPRGAVVAALAPYRDRLVNVNVDAIGVGYNFALHLEDQGFPVTQVNVGERPTSDHTDRFANLKAQLYWALREAIAAGDIVDLTDDIAVSQLVSIRYRQDSRGHIVIESKEAARKRGVKSPDRAESVMLAFANVEEDGGEVVVGSYMRGLYR
jgi:phage terminase large subunit